MRTAIFLGAGASAAEGAPMQDALFKYYFKAVKQLKLKKDKPTGPEQMKHELTEFFRLIFDIDVNDSRLDKIVFPTFEEALGMLDLAELRRESLRQFNLEDVGAHGNRIRLVRQYIILAMAQAIADNLHKVKGLHNNDKESRS